MLMRRKRHKKIIRLFDAAINAETNYDFQKAKNYYREVVREYPNSPEGEIALDRIEDMDLLSKEKRLYKKIDRDARRILTEIGIDISSSPELMEILMEADAIDFDREDAVFVPLRDEYIEECIERAPTDLEEDPGENAFGVGATAPFLLRPGRDELLPATRQEFEAICQTAREFKDSIGIFSIPVATDKSINDLECAMMMEKYFSDLKMTFTKNMSDEEITFFRNKEDWLDGTSLITSLTFMPSMVRPFIRSIQNCRNILLLDLTIAASTGPASPAALLTQVHAQVLFMVVLAQTINPGVCCVHGGIPDVLGSGGDLSYSDPGQPIINSAMARLNMWYTGLPSAQSGGSTSIVYDIPAAVEESELSRNTLREYGVHILRHSLGSLGSLNYFSREKFIMDCEREREARRIWLQTKHDFVIPLHVPEDHNVISGIREIISKGGPKNADHTLNNIDSFNQWHAKLIKESEKKVYYPDLKDTIKTCVRGVERTDESTYESQLVESRERTFDIEPDFGTEIDTSEIQSEN